MTTPNGITYTTQGERSPPKETTEEPRNTIQRPKTVEPINYHMLSKFDIIRQITQGHKLYLKYASARTKIELIQILEELDNGRVPDKIDAIW